MRMQAIGALVLGMMLVMVGPANAATIASFPASDFNSNTALMDQTLGITGYTIEGFESTTLISGLSITLSNFNNGHPDETLTSLPQLYSPGTDTPNFSNNLWDGTYAFNNSPNNGSVASYGGSPPVAEMTTFSFAGGVNSVGIGLSNFQSLDSPSFPITDHYLYINGVQQSGTLESIVGGNWTPGLARNAYLVFNASSGESIDSIGFQNINTNSNDFLIFDHLAIQSVPEPSSLMLVATSGSLLLAIAARRRANKGHERA